MCLKKVCIYTYKQCFSQFHFLFNKAVATNGLYEYFSVATNLVELFLPLPVTNKNGKYMQTFHSFRLAACTWVVGFCLFLFCVQTDRQTDKLTLTALFSLLKHSKKSPSFLFFQMNLFFSFCSIHYALKQFS